MYPNSQLLFNGMPSPGDGRRRETERRARPNCTPFRQMQKAHRLGIHRSSSGLAFSSFSLSQSSNDSLFGSSISSWGQNLSRSFRPTFSSWDRGGSSVGGENKRRNGGVELGYLREREGVDGLKRCKWITQYSDEVYISFHDECWGLPVYDDRHAFELLALCGMLIDLNWTEILKRRELYRDAFAKFDYTKIVNMEEKEIVGIASNKELCLGEGRVRCIVENANCIQKVCEEFGSFREFMWGHVKNKATVNKYKEQRSVPLRSPKAEAISKDLVRRGFRLVGPVIVYSFMQAAGMAVDHILGCFRFHECARVANLS